jgi:hypothetical protein
MFCVMLTCAGRAFAEGDLTHQPTCIAELYGQADLRIVGWMWVGNDRYDTEAQGYGYTMALLDPVVPASAEDRFVSCNFEYYYGDAGSWYYLGGDSDSWIIDGSGPAILDVVMDAFIPYQYLRQPFDPFSPYPNNTLIAQGDDRGFTPSGGTYRAGQVINLYNPAYFDQTVAYGPEPGVGLSTEYDADTSLSNPGNLGSFAPSGGSLLWVAQDDWEWGPPYKTRWATAGMSGISCDSPERLGQEGGPETSRLRVRCFGSVYFPLHSFAPAVDWDFTYTFTFGHNEVAFQVTGCRDGFPAYEVYGTQQTILQHTDNGDPMALFASCGNSISESGVIR